ncbi:hypothetical protein B0I75DRAFT_166965 [Yarrowia lipolytica]|nr:hypothetical protein B0I74DRAFT_164162 [Yarrowia lipolytica]RDW50787.1 hypothetical protein B0I75DRAFT_166965 [Yarrowia lipolytica]
MRLLAIITLCKTSLALSHPSGGGGGDIPFDNMRHMTSESKWKSAESELQGFYTRSSLREDEMMSLDSVMEKISEGHHSTFTNWSRDVIQTREADDTPNGLELINSTVTAAPTTISITDSSIETAMGQNPESTFDNIAAPPRNSETKPFTARYPLESDPTPTPYFEPMASSAAPSPASTGSSNHAPTQSFGVVLLALGAFFL